MDNKIGTYYKYLVADVTGKKYVRSPVQNSAGVPVYLGLGPETPLNGGMFTVGRRLMRAVQVYDRDHPLNPFPCDLVVAERVSK